MIFITLAKLRKKPTKEAVAARAHKIDEDDLWTFCAAFIDYWKAH